MIVYNFVYIFVFVSTEWEAAKNAEPVKEVPSQPLIVETTAAPSTQTETYNQQVTMMPVQVFSQSVVECEQNSLTVLTQFLEEHVVLYFSILQKVGLS